MVERGPEDQRKSMFPICQWTVIFLADLFHVQISTLQGNIDVSWRIRGTKGILSRAIYERSSEFNVQAGSGTLYFTSIRKEKGQPFTICASVSLFLHYVTYMFFQYASKSSAMTVPLLSLTLNQYNHVLRYLSRTPATLFDKNNIFRASSPFMTGSKHLNTIVVEEKQLCLGQYIPRQRRLWVRGSEDYTLAVMAVILLVQRSRRVKSMIG